MKEINAIIQPFMLEKVLDALRGIENLPGLAVSELRAFRRTRGRAAERGCRQPGGIREDDQGRTRGARCPRGEGDAGIEESAPAGNIGDGKI